MWEALKAIVIGFLPLGGVWLGWFLQRRDRASERDRDARNLLRSKAEEIYQEIESAHDRNKAAVMGAIELAHKDDAALGDLIPNLGRLKALVHMYFPAGAVLLSQYDQAVAQPLNACVTQMTAIDAEIGLEPVEKLKKFTAARLVCVNNASNELIALLSKLTAFMNGEVKKLI